MRHIDDDAVANASGIFVAEEGGRILGYITTTLDRATGKGRIPNVAGSFRDEALKLAALGYFGA